MRSYKTDQKAARPNTRIVLYYSFVDVAGILFYNCADCHWLHVELRLHVEPQAHMRVPW